MVDALGTVLPAAALLLLLALAMPPAAAEDMEPPIIHSDATPETATTGDEFTFQVSVFDESGLQLVEVSYSYGSGAEVSVPMTTEGGAAPWTVTVRIQPYPETLHYVFRAMDIPGNSRQTSPRHVQVVDDDPPRVLSDISPDQAEPGEVYVFGVELSDNEAVAGAWVHHWFDDEPPRNLTLVEGHPYTQEVQVPPEGVSELSYLFEAVDRLGNGMRTGTRTVPVVTDRRAPSFGRDSTDAAGTTGDAFTFTVEVTDDVELEGVRVRFRLGEGDVTNETLVGDNPFRHTITLPPGSTAEVNYSFWASDAAGNANLTRWKRVRVHDNDGPAAEAGDDLEVWRGRLVILDGSASTDNIGVEGYLWTFLYGGDMVELETSRPTFRFNRAGEYEVTLTAIDKEGNQGTDTVWVRVREGGEGPADGAFPEAHGEGLSLPLLLALALAAAGVVVWAVVAYRRRRPPRRWPTGPRSTSSRSQVGYSSTR